GERRRLARALEAAHARRRPRDHVAAHVGDGDDGVVERRLDVSDAALDVLLDLLLGDLGHDDSLRPRLGSRRGDATELPLARALARTRVGVRALAAHRQALTMAQAAIAAEIHQPLDVDRNLAPQIALDLDLL